MDRPINDHLLRHFQRLAARHGAPALGREWFLALTKADPGTGDYPPAGQRPNAYWITLCDVTFTETAGVQTATATERSADPRVVAFHLGDDYLDEETLVAVVKRKGKWFILPLTRVGFVIGVLDDDLLYGATATLSVYDGAQLAETDTGRNLTVSAWELQDPGDVVVAGTAGVASWNGCAWYFHAAKCAAASS